MPKEKWRVTISEATRADILALIELNKAAYPVLADENVVRVERHLRSRQPGFP